MSNISERLGLTKEVREIKLGRSFANSGNGCFNTFRYDFKPASMDTKKMATVDIGEAHQVTVTVPHIEGSGTAHTVFKGSKKPYQKECVLIIDNVTGEMTLEKLSFNVQLKKTRAEGSSKIRSNTPVDNNVSSKKSPAQKHSPQQKSFWSSSNHYSPVPKCSPLPKSPNSQSSPTSQTSPSMPCLVPPNSSFNSRHSTPAPQEVPMLAASGGEISAMDVPEVGMLTSSSESSGSSSSSDSESSDGESEQVSKTPMWPQTSGLTNGNSDSANKGKSSSQHSANVLPSMPKFNLLCEDLKLSESDSDSDD